LAPLVEFRQDFVHAAHRQRAVALVRVAHNPSCYFR
jgi:hypothetical protein